MEIIVKPVYKKFLWWQWFHHEEMYTTHQQIIENRECLQFTDFRELSFKRTDDLQYCPNCEKVSLIDVMTIKVGERRNYASCGTLVEDIGFHSCCQTLITPEQQVRVNYVL